MTQKNAEEFIEGIKPENKAAEHTLMKERLWSLLLEAGMRDLEQPLLQFTDFSSEEQRWSIRDLLLHAALGQLDSEHHDVMTMLASCTPASKGKPIRSLRGLRCVGTPPEGDIPLIYPYLGAESLVGHAVSRNCQIIIHDSQESVRVPLPRRGGHRSLVTAPLLRDGAISGAFTAASSRPWAFSREHLRIIERYTTLLAATYPDSAFFPPPQIALIKMPPVAIQAPYLAHFDNRVRKLCQQETTLTKEQAEILIWQQLEEELSWLALDEGDIDSQ